MPSTKQESVDRIAWSSVPGKLVRSARDRLDSLPPARVAALFGANGQGTIRIGALVTCPADGPTHALDFEFSAQRDLLPVHALGENEGALPKLAGVRLACIEVTSDFDSTVRTLGVDAQNSRNSRHSIVDQA